MSTAIISLLWVKLTLQGTKYIQFQVVCKVGTMSEDLVLKWERGWTWEQWVYSVNMQTQKCTYMFPVLWLHSLSDVVGENASNFRWPGNSTMACHRALTRAINENTGTFEDDAYYRLNLQAKSYTLMWYVPSLHHCERKNECIFVLWPFYATYYWKHALRENAVKFADNCSSY